MKPIPEHESYGISRDGRVWSYKRSKFLRASDNGAGYLKVKLGRKGGQFYVHRLVATTYLPIIAGKIEINHKDGHKANNAVSNLEWCTSSENSRHYIEVLGGSSAGSSRKQAVTNGIKTYGSMNAAASDGFSQSCISRVISGEYKTHKGFNWKLV